MNCPRCKSPIPPLSSPDAIVTCPGCGSRLMTKAAARRSQGGQTMLPTDPPVAPSTKGPVVGTETVAPTAFAPSPPRPSPPTAPPTRPLPPPNATMPPSSSPVVAGAVPVARRESTPPPPETLERVLREIRAVRELQERLLAMLEGSLYGIEPGAPEAGEGESASLAPIRAPRRKSVLLIDDEAKSREAAVRELSQADVPVRAVAEGNEALRAIVEDKPDVIALELGLRGDMGGKDLINVIKATMEWVDIPIVLWTREPVASQKEARQIHGADELALKTGGAAGLLARVITIFRRG